MSDVFDDEEASEGVLTPLEIYEQLVACNEIILTIPAEEEDKLRKGLASAKSKQNTKLKEAGLPTDNTVLSFTSSPSKEHEGAIDLHIVLGRRSGVKVYDMRLPDPEI